jgi:hypothetical protein
MVWMGGRKEDFFLEIAKEVVKIAAIFIPSIERLTIGEFIGLAIVTPRPPYFTTFAQIEFLPFPFSTIDEYGGTTIEPNCFGCRRTRTATGTTKLDRVGGCLDPFWRCGAEGIHSK